MLKIEVQFDEFGNLEVNLGVWNWNWKWVNLGIHCNL